MATRSTNKDAQAKLVQFVLAHPELSYQTIADRLHCTVATISRICILHDVRRKRKNLTIDDLSMLVDTDNQGG